MAVGVAALAVVAEIFTRTPAVPPVQAPSPPNQPIVSPEQKADQEKEQKVAGLIKTEDLARCAEVKGTVIGGADYETVCRNNIALSIAMKKLDKSYCQKLDDKLFKIGDCEQQVLFGKLAQQKSIIVCDEATTVEMKTSCVAVYWLDQAVAKWDIKLCGNVPGDQEKTNCQNNYSLALLIRDPGKISCDTMPSQLQGDCKTFKETVKNQDTRACQLIRNLALQAACQRLRQQKPQKP